MLQFFSYKLPFFKHFLTSGHKFNHRKGVVAQLSKEGITAWGEAAPLPGFSSESYQNVVKQLQNYKEPIAKLLDSLKSLQQLDDFNRKHKISPSLQFCVFTLCSTFLAQKKDSSLHEFLFYNINNRVPVNAVIDLGEQDILSIVNTCKSQGFATLKIKVDSNIERLISQLKVIRKNHPRVKLRIDANQSWTLSQALNIFQQITPFNIEYCEEPLVNPSLQSLQKLKKQTSIPIALDESLVQPFTIKEASKIIDVLIIKPTVLGMKPAMGFVKEAAKRNHPKIVFTTSLEGAIGRLMAATLAAGLGSKNLAHGLATAHLLANDFWSDEQRIRNGLYNLPDAASLKKLMQINTDSLPLEALDL